VNRRWLLTVATGLAAVLLLATGAWVAFAADFDLGWYVTAGGGGHSSSISYILDGTIGQPLVGVLSGGPYTLASGFWPGAAGAAPPTAITLLSFSASGQDEHVVLNWETAAEIDNEGFNLWRAEAADGEYTKLNPSLIPARGNPDTGASYEYTDINVVKGVAYYYKLEDVDIHGVSTFHGPVSATASSIRDIYLPLIYKE